MYTDTLLFIIGGAGLALCLGLAVWLLASRRRSRSYRTLLQQETEFYSALSETAREAEHTELHDPAPGRTQRLTQPGTSLLTDADAPVGQGQPAGLDAAALEGRYQLLREIHGGGMSRVFLARSTRLGNLWIVKYISGQAGALQSEEHILKLLNHNSLPRIIDIFHDAGGVYLVESYIEGASLDKVLAGGQRPGQAVIADWAEQLAQVLSYLHRMEPHPIHHLDLKPSNIMVTHDNRLVLIDFGISKRHGADDSRAVGVTYAYAAPEQLGHGIPDEAQALMRHRFGALPEGRGQWPVDARTDLYSLGVILFELATGQLPGPENLKKLGSYVSDELAAIIRRCLENDPGHRYQTAAELLGALQKIKGSKLKMARALLVRRLATVSTALSLVISAGGLGGGYYVYGQENLALLDVEPEVLTLSLQQSSDLKVEKLMPGGAVVLLESKDIRWSADNTGVAQVDGTRVVGVNVGEAALLGQYRSKTATIRVRVVEPMDGLVDIAQRYRPGGVLARYAGTAEREHTDGPLTAAELVSPEGIAVADDGTVYLTDAGVLRRIQGGQVETVTFEPEYLSAHRMACLGSEVYILTDPWQEESGYYYGIIRLGGSGAEGIFRADAQYTAVEDMAFGPDGRLWFIQRNEGVGETWLTALDPQNPDSLEVVETLPHGAAALALDDEGRIYIAEPESGVIHLYSEGVLRYFSGAEGQRAFIDGPAPQFYLPQRLAWRDGWLYVWDFNTLRRVEARDGAAGPAETVAGQASPDFDLEPGGDRFAAEEVILPNSALTGFAVLEGGRVLLTDPKRGIIWTIE